MMASLCTVNRVQHTSLHFDYGGKKPLHISLYVLKSLIYTQQPSGPLKYNCTVNSNIWIKEPVL